MSLKKVQQVKKDKGFKIFDLLIYGVIILVIAALFLAFVVTRKEDPIQGIQVLYKKEVVLTFNFEDGSCAVTSGKESHVGDLVETEKKVTFTFYAADESQYNEITIDKENKSAYVTSANCNRFEGGKECVHMQSVASTADTILCTPHAMEIVPLGYESDDGEFKDTPNSTVPV